jgi:hypothetical protein
MVAVASGDANRRFEELLRRVEARLIPSGPAASHDDRRDVIERWLSEHSHVRLNGLRIEDLIAEGRRG